MDKATPRPIVGEHFERKPGAKPLNILWITLDHVTFRHYKMTTGARPVLNTYERLAAQGTEFTNCHSVHPLCLPARASMLNGMYAHNHGKLNNDEFPDPCLPFFSDYLLHAGYQVGYFGKNHSGYEDFAERGMEGCYPASYGNPYHTPQYKAYLQKHSYGDPVYCQEWGMVTGKTLYPNGNYSLLESNNFNTYSAGYLLDSGKVHESDFLISEALSWLDKTLAEGKPFALRVDMWGPHHAYQVPHAFKDLIDAALIEEYPTFGECPEQKADLVQLFQKRICANNPLSSWEDWQPLMKRAYEQYSYIDCAVGEMLDALERKGLSDNTVVIYTADHGDALGSHGGLVDKAGDVMEEVMHIPMVIRWPGATAGQKSAALVSNLDLPATVLECAGLVAPDYMDSKSMAGLIHGEIDSIREDFMAEHYGHFGIHAPQRALYYQQYKYIATQNDVHELYDLDRDPFERYNLVNDPDSLPIVAEMQRRLLQNMDRLDDNAGDVQDIRQKAAAAKEC